MALPSILQVEIDNWQKEYVMRIIGSLLALSVFSSPMVHADDSTELESVMVTGSRISYDDLFEIPAVSLTKPADYLLKVITLTNDTRDPDKRRQELTSTIDGLLNAAGNRVEILQESVVLTKGKVKIDLIEDTKRLDVSHVTLMMRAKLAEWKNDGSSVHAFMQELVSNAELKGRTLIEAEEGTSLSMQRPERYRYELMAAISKDIVEMQKQLDLGCKIEIAGLNGRIQWERASLSELLLYIPHTVTLMECANEPKASDLKASDLKSVK